MKISSTLILCSLPLLFGCLGGPIAKHKYGEKPEAGERIETMVFMDPSAGPTGIITNRVNQYPDTWQDINQQNVVLQKHDYSCGAAALTTMLQHYFKDDVTEQEVLRIIFYRLARSENAVEAVKDRIEHGLSLLDLQLAAKDLGYQSAVAKIKIEKFQELKAPVVIRIIKNDFKHFVVFRGIIGDRVFLADPIRGNLRMSVAEFNDQWDGPALFLGKKGFGLPENHPLAVHENGMVQHELYHVRNHLIGLP